MISNMSRFSNNSKRMQGGFGMQPFGFGGNMMDDFFEDGFGGFGNFDSQFQNMMSGMNRVGGGKAFGTSISTSTITK